MQPFLATIGQFFAAYWLYIAVVALLIGHRLVLRFFGILIVPDNHVGVVNKKFKIFGRNRTLPGGAIMALHGEAGWQADTLAPGLQYFMWPWQYEIKYEEFRAKGDF